MPRRRTPETLSTNQRHQTAKQRAAKLINHIDTLLLMQATNAAVVYSPQLSSQIPVSYAAHAFNQLQRSLHLFELVRLAALWDSFGEDRESIPTIVDLIDSDEVIQLIANERRNDYAREVPEAWDVSSDGRQQVNREMGLRIRDYLASEAASNAVRETRRAIDEARQILASDERQALKRLRDEAIAHNLETAALQRKQVAEVRAVKYGDERDLLMRTMELAGTLHSVLNGVSYDWDASRDIARMYASDLWDRCRFDFSSGSPAPG